ncbi:hypothetical protein GUJ93_ZPchr0011g28244 [Zizania palustris]|uniref:Uncharacterized protein n=1 Tax=Zizania palustris TaxID=103762 RepID=A0A8J5WJ87_ZIZPA|nr:hypothetical protein GUJ93_ZPchr0011g28244 [Zizania palustris]
MPSLTTTGRSPWRRKKKATAATTTTTRRRRTASLRALWRRLVPTTSTTTTTTTTARVGKPKPGLLSRAFRVLSCGGGRRGRTSRAARRRW